MWQLKKNNIKILSTLLIIVLIIGGVNLWKDEDNNQSKNKSTEVLSEEKVKEPQENKEDTKEENIVTYENGDFVFIPSSDDISHDDEEEIFYYENILNVYLSSEISDNKANELAKIVDGNIVGKLQGTINMLQIQVVEESYSELNKLASRLDSDEAVNHAQTSTPSFISNLNNSSSKDDEDADWWSDAINAPYAWEYIENNPDKLEKVKVGVVEINSIKDKRGNVPEDIKDSVELENDSITGDKKEHPEEVTRFIVADKEKNPDNFQGVATGVVEVYFKSIGGEIGGLEIVEGVPEPYVFSEVKTIIDDGVKIINNSWGDSPKSEKKWRENQNAKVGEYFTFTYEGYLKSHKKSQDEVSAQLIIALDRLLSKENDKSSEIKKEEFLIIQAAGNGKSLYKPEEDENNHEKMTKETATESENTGFFTNINENTYMKAVEITKEGLNHDLEEILSHTIIVGGAERTDNKDIYQVPEWTSYGNAIDIVAPAADLPNGGDGTSYAAPMVSGAAALAWSYNPELSASEVKNLLLNTSLEDVKDSKNIVDKEYKKQSYPMLNMTAFLTNYNSLLNTYRQAIVEQWDYENLDKLRLGPLNYDRQPLPYDYGYDFKDINGNGDLELILGVNQENGEPWIQEIYTLRGNSPSKILESAIRTTLNIYEDGTIESCTSESAGTILSCVSYEINGDLVEGSSDDESTIETDIYKNKDLIREITNETTKELNLSFTPFLSEQ